MMTLSEDYDPIVRSELIGQFPHIAAFFNEKGSNATILYNLWPILINYLGTDNSQVRKASHTTLLSVVEQRTIDLETVTGKILPLVVHLTDSAHPEELRTDSILLMSKLAVLLGKKITEAFFLQCILSLCVDTVTSVRKACALAFGDVCTTVGRETTEVSLLPRFIELCEDSAWGVRKACAENFMPVSCVVSRETRCNELAETYMFLLKDISRWVRITAYQGLGPFISTFAEPNKTGLYYSKDGVLTIVDVPESPDTLSKSRNDGEQCRDTNFKNSEYPKDVERTNSDTCDSIVPLSSSEKSLSASDIPGISCHVGNYCTVIEVSCSSTTSADEAVDDAINIIPKPNGRLCFMDEVSDNMQSESNSDTNEINKTAMNDLNSGLNNSIEDVDSTKCLNEIGESGDNAKSLNELEYLIQSGNLLENLSSNSDSTPLVNGDICKLSEDIEDCFPECEKTVLSKEVSTLLNSVTVNGIHVNLPETSILTLNCETTAVVNCVNRNSKNNTNIVEEMELNQDSVPNSEYEESEIQMNGTGSIVDTCTESSVKIVENNADESAFNHFQYWRLPLEEINSNNIVSDLCNFVTSSKRKAQPYFGRHFRSFNVREKKRDFRDQPKEEEYDGVSDDLSLAENKDGEPPPGEDNVSAYDQDIVPAKLLKCYLTMIDTAWTEVAHHCAYSLPAVAFTLGRKYWPCLKETFNALSSDLQGFIMMWKVRRTVASSMHQLAVILGSDITSKDLLPVFSRFIYDLDEVRIGILQHISAFLKVLRPEERKSFLPCLSEFLKSNSNSESNEKNWRFRLILAEQLVSVADLYEPQDVRDHLVPLSLTLIQDKICEVRLAAVRVMAAVMRRMSQHPTPDLTKAVLSELTEKFIHSPKWIHRQLYVYVCQEFIVESSLPPDQFAEDALPQLLYLCWDRVPNIRIAIARCLAVVIWPLETFSGSESPHRELLLQTIHTLQSDCDADVQFYANMVSTLECSCLVHEEFTNLPV